MPLCGPIVMPGDSEALVAVQFAQVGVRLFRVALRVVRDGFEDVQEFGNDLVAPGESFGYSGPWRSSRRSVPFGRRMSRISMALPDSVQLQAFRTHPTVVKTGKNAVVLNRR